MAIARGGIKRRLGVVLLAATAMLVVGQATVASAGAAQTVTVAPTGSPDLGNCYPFGRANPGQWEPFMGFVYMNVPAFQLKTGDVIAFDTDHVNDADPQLQIELAATTANGGDTPALPYTTVVTNTQTPANPTGDTTVGNFELRFTAQAPFSFEGGGLIIRFSNPSASYQTDATCTGDLVGAPASDPSGKFVKRFYADTDGLPPYPNFDMADIGAFQLTIADVPSSPSPPSQPVAKKKCKKHKHHAAASAKKHCKKKKR